MLAEAGSAGVALSLAVAALAATIVAEALQEAFNIRAFSRAIDDVTDSIDDAFDGFVAAVRKLIEDVGLALYWIGKSVAALIEVAVNYLARYRPHMARTKIVVQPCSVLPGVAEHVDVILLLRGIQSSWHEWLL